MITYYGNFQFKTMDFLVKLLQNDPYLTTLVEGRVSTSHPATLEKLPKLPAITISRTGLGGDASIENIDYGFIVIDIWCKAGVAQLHSIYASNDPVTNKPVGVRSLLHNQGFSFTEAIIHKMSEIWVTDTLYESDTKTYHLQARYSMYSAAQTLII